MFDIGGGFWDYMVAGNTVEQYAVAVILFVFALIVLKAIKVVLVSRVHGVVKKTETHFDDAILEVFDTIRPPFYVFVAFYGATRSLVLQGALERVFEVVLLVWITWQVVAALQIFVDHLVRYRLAQANDVAKRAVSGIVGGLAKIILWIIGILFVLSNLGVNINSLLAGVGIGGLALALAARSLLEDLFSSLAIFFDRPFTPGDFIEIGNEKGVVQKVGIKTTRLRSISGEEVIIPNKDISSARIRNYKRMKERRVSFPLKISSSTSQEEIEKLPKIIADIVKPHARFEWALLTEMDGDSMHFDVVYYVGTEDYSDYLRAHQDVLLGIKTALEKEKIALV